MSRIVGLIDRKHDQIRIIAHLEERIVDRSSCLIAKAPQCFFLKDIYAAHMKAKSENRHDFIDSACLMNHYGYKLHSIEGPSSNIKITTPVDFYIFKAIQDLGDDNKEDS